MKKRASDMIVGLAVLGVVAALAVSLAWVQRADMGQRKDEVVSRLRDVGNTRVGNAVVLRGVIAGRIQAIELAPAGWVDVRMKLDRGVTLPADPVVLLNESSLFGEWQATIVERGSVHDETVVKQLAEATGTRGMLPGTALPGIGKLTTVAGQIAGDVAGVAGRIQVAFDEQAARELRGSIKNVAELSSVLSSTVREHASDLDTISLQLRSAVASLNRTAASVSRVMAQIDSSASHGDVKHIVDNVAVASAELRRATTQVRDLTERFAKSQSRFDTFLANGDSILVKVNAGQGSLGLFVNDPSLYRRTDSTLAVLQALLKDVKANPGKYVRISIF